jgi:two-component system sensor histidine kinase LytS
MEDNLINFHFLHKGNVMAAFDFKVLLLWLDNAAQIMQWITVVLVLAHVSMRINWLKKAIRGSRTHWRYALITSIFFGLLAILGNHSRMIWEMNANGHLEIKQFLSSMKWIEGRASVSLREVMVLVAGLSAGPWVGLGSGLIAGYERFFVGDMMSSSSAITTPLLGVLAGLVIRYYPHCALNYWGVLVVALSATWIKLMIVYHLTAIESAHSLVWATVIPASMVSAIGCLLFMSVIKDLERDRQEQLLQNAELRALKAQIEPHFLNNTLNDLHTFIRTDPDKARDYVVLLADFCNDTRQFSEYNTVSLYQELTQLQRYLDFQSLRLGDKLQVTFDIPEGLFSTQVLPGSLLTLAENSHKHGFRKRPPPYKLEIRAQEQGQNLILSVSDNGQGISPEQKSILGNEPIPSMNKGGGVALYQLAQCLNLILGKDARITFERGSNGGTVAKLIQPKRSGL